MNGTVLDPLPNSPVIKTQHLTKYYGGKVLGIKDISLEIFPSEIFGLLGSNGAGKTTLIRLLMNFISPTSGRVNLFGQSNKGRDSVKLRERIGYLPAPFSTYDGLSGKQLLNYFTSIRGSRPVLLKELLEMFEYNPSRKIKHLSHGNIQKLGIIQAFMHDPDIVILDEPTTGLDPVMRQRFDSLIKSMAKRGKTIVLSSHNLYEIQTGCSHIGIIRSGKLVKTFSANELHEGLAKLIEARFTGPVSAEAFVDLPGVSDIVIDGNRLRCRVSGDMSIFVTKLSELGVADLISHIPSLEDAFFNYYQKDTSKV